MWFEIIRSGETTELTWENQCQWLGYISAFKNDCYFPSEVRADALVFTMSEDCICSKLLLMVGRVGRSVRTLNWVGGGGGCRDTLMAGLRWWSLQNIWLGFWAGNGHKDDKRGNYIPFQRKIRVLSVTLSAIPSRKIKASELRGVTKAKSIKFGRYFNTS